jgi:hypothetical protein
MPLTETELEELIDLAAAGPKKAAVDNRSAEQHSLKDLLAVKQDRAADVAAGEGHFGLRFTKLVPPGCG